MLRAGENEISFPSVTPAVDLSPLNILKPRPGEFFAVMDPPRTRTAGGIMLRAVGDGWTDPHTEMLDQAERAWEQKSQEAIERINIYRADPGSESAKRLAFMAAEVAMAAYEFLEQVQDPQNPGYGLTERPDSYTVAAVGANVPFSPGDRVMIAPYAARRFKFLCGVRDVVLVGREDPWEDIVPLIWSPLSLKWELLANWVAVQLAAKPRAVATARRTFLNLGRVLEAGPDADSVATEFVALHRDRTIHRPNDTKWFATKNGPWDGMGVLLVRETDSTGARRILATLDVEVQS